MDNLDKAIEIYLDEINATNVDEVTNYWNNYIHQNPTDQYKIIQYFLDLFYDNVENDNLNKKQTLDFITILSNLC